METNQKRLEKYSGIALGTVLMMAFVLVQPAMMTAHAVDAEAIPAWDNCQLTSYQTTPFPDLITQESISKGDIVKTVHAEKEVFFCNIVQGNIPVIVDVSTYIELYENITAREVIKGSALVTSCIKSVNTAVLIGCESYVPSTNPVPVGTSCSPLSLGGVPNSPTELDIVKKGKNAKTIESQKEIWLCQLSGGVLKKVDLVVFTEIYQDLNTQEVIETQFHAMRCVVLINDNSDDRRDGTVESCIFSTVPT